MERWVSSVSAFILCLTCILESIIFAPGQEAHTDLPSVIMVSIPSYRGPTEWYRDDGVPIVPIVPSVARWEKNGRHCSRKQFPLRLAYAISIKSQEMTLRKVVIELGLLEFCRCLSFVAISRAKAITDIAFLNRIGEQRLKKLGGSRVKEIVFASNASHSFPTVQLKVQWVQLGPHHLCTILWGHDMKELRP